MSFFKQLSVLLLLIFFTSGSYASHFSFEINEKGVRFKEGERSKRHQPFYWETYTGEIPPHAVIGGYENGRNLYICQASYRHGLHPGKIVDEYCHITYAGRDIPQTTFRILVGKGLHWVRNYPGEVLTGRVSGGHEHGSPLFICQARMGKSMYPGKIVDGACHIGFDGREIEKRDYRVLIFGNGYALPHEDEERGGFGTRGSVHRQY